MKIIAYNKDGKVKSVTEYADFVPNYVLTFDDTKSPLNITEEEIRVINSRKKSFEKSLTLLRLGLAIRNDFENYVKKVSLVDKHDTTPGFSDTDIVDKDEYLQINKVLTDILSLTYRRNRGYCEQLFESASEKLKGGKWFAGLYMRALKSAQNSKQSQRFNSTSLEKIEVRTFMKFLFLLHRYYYALRWCESLLPNELKRQLYIASVFANAPHDFFHSISCISLESSYFVKKIAIALFNMNEQKRNELYESVILVLGIVKGEKTHSEFTSFHIAQDNSSSRNLIITGKDFKVEIEISRSEIAAMNVQGKQRDIIFKRIASILDKIYIDYTKDNFFVNKWKEEVDNAYDTMRSINSFGLKQWLAYKKEEINRVNLANPFQPQLCFINLVLKRARFGEQVSFDNQLIYDLLYVLYKNRCDYQIGLYESRFKIDYIFYKASKEEIVPTSKVIDDILSFLEPIFNGNFIKLDILKIDDLKDLLKIIFNNEIFKSSLGNAPRSFKNFTLNINGYFDIKTVYRILAVLISETNIFKIRIAYKISKALLANHISTQYDIGNDNFRKYLSHTSDEYDRWFTSKAETFKKIIDKFRISHKNLTCNIEIGKNKK